ncbi:helix-turn-helix domain-containing protein [Streptomyces albidoflavus]|uniref:helix-turn-helix domain-containing protein n=1 Tax=Streptomyces albidoflavus TaxID=1886 RepID=UPI001FD48E66|nr:helix-turn-helix transcriptional regulator [Streptomyces albidoflavus]
MTDLVTARAADWCRHTRGGQVGHPEPTVRKKRLGAELRRLREEAGITAAVAGEAIDGDKTKMSRIETGRQGIRPLELKTLLDLYKVEPKLRDALLALQRQSKQKGWWSKHSDTLKPQFEERLTLESDATRIYAYQSQIVPGLLQTPRYAEAAIRGVAEKRASDDEVKSLVDLRIARQDIFDSDEAPQYLCILDESVLHRKVGGPAVAAEQLRNLIRMTTRPGIVVQVIPFGQGAYPGMDGPFTVYSYPDPMELDVVGLDYLDGGLYLEESSAVERYRSAFDHLRSAALSSRESMHVIERLAHGLENE